MSVAGPGAELLAVDLGTQSLRLAAYDDAGRRRWAWSAPVDSHIEGDVFEQSPEQWESLLLQGLGEAQRAGVRPVALAAAGPLAGYVALGADGRALGAGERRSCAPGAHSAWAGSCGSSAPVLRCPRARPHDRTTARLRYRTTARLRGSPPLRRADAAAPPHALTGTDTNACACMRICSHTRTRPYLQLRVGYG